MYNDATGNSNSITVLSMHVWGDGPFSAAAAASSDPFSVVTAVSALVKIDLVRQRQVAAASGYAGQLEVDGLPLVVQRRGLEYDGARAHDTRQREHPQEEPVEHHRHVLPVLDHLCEKNANVEKATKRKKKSSDLVAE